ncbi:MAG: hypothetical protein EOP36_14590 [Rubrivivax sp.]|nr:MAG: hypothetical protein EOP36_14590 [Rubrivivax sp.]
MHQSSIKRALLLLLWAWAGHASAAPIYGYALGVSLHQLVVPGQLVNIHAQLMNTGSTPIAFPAQITNGPPSVQGGSTPFGGANAGGQWDILAQGFQFGPSGDVNFFRQFNGVVINPGETFNLVFGHFRAPLGEALGTSATPSIDLGLNFTDSIVGVLDMGEFGFHNTPVLKFTLATAPSVSKVSFFEGLVFDQVSGQIIHKPSAPAIPEPSSIWLFSAGMVMLYAVGRSSLARRWRAGHTWV